MIAPTSEPGLAGSVGLTAPPGVIAGGGRGFFRGVTFGGVGLTGGSGRLVTPAF
jgi:hypothetical protein